MVPILCFFCIFTLIVSVFEFLSFVTIWIVEFCHNLSSVKIRFFYFLAIWVFEFSLYLSFDTIWQTVNFSQKRGRGSTPKLTFFRLIDLSKICISLVIFFNILIEVSIPNHFRIWGGWVFWAWHRSSRTLQETTRFNHTKNGNRFCV